jgi:hypothetical protein
MNSLPVSVRLAVEADVPVLLWGPPGVGKTASVEAAAEEAGAALVTLSAEDARRADWAGIIIPDLSAGRAKKLAPEWALELHQALSQGLQAWLFLDELTAWPSAARAEILCLVQSKRFAGLNLKGLRILAAANPPDWGEDCGELGPSSANRWAHHQWKVDPAAWAEGARTGWGRAQPPALGAARALIARFIVAAQSSTDSHRKDGGAPGSVPPLLILPKDPTRQGQAWPSPRSWDNAARLLAAAGGNVVAACTAIAGCVGESAAGEFLAWWQGCDLPDPEMVLADPLNAPVPTRLDAAQAACEAVAAAACADHPQLEQRWAAAWQYIARVDADLSLGAARTLARARSADPVWRGKPMPAVVETSAARYADLLEVATATGGDKR